MASEKTRKVCHVVGVVSEAKCYGNGQCALKVEFGRGTVRVVNGQHGAIDHESLALMFPASAIDTIPCHSGDAVRVSYHPATRKDAAVLLSVTVPANTREAARSWFAQPAEGS